MTKPVRLQLSRKRGFNLQELSRATNGLEAVVVRRPTKWGNPFRIGGYFMVGDPVGRGPLSMAWCEAAPDWADDRFTLIETHEQAVDFYRRLLAKHPPRNIDELRGKNLACTCRLDQACHADVLLELALTPSGGAP